MRTTLDIDDDVLQAAKELARYEGSTAGKIISELVRRGLAAPSSTKRKSPKYLNGIPQFPSRGEIVTMKHIQDLMDKEGI